MNLILNKKDNRYRTYTLDGVEIAKVILDEYDSSVYIQNFRVSTKYRRQGIGRNIVKLLLKEFDNKMLYGDVCYPDAARFWGTFDKHIPIYYSDEDLDVWCINYGLFEFNTYKEWVILKEVVVCGEGKVLKPIDNGTDVVIALHSNPISSDVLKEADLQIIDMEVQNKIDKNRQVERQKWLKNI